ncbi:MULTISPECIES: hypothetical protein [Veillonella]|uniref:hypothetical protein n=1 Tax=Veillonella TaxID=29465 RepID=UPI00034E20A6|nr:MULTISPECIES: hypothetical protein [Veillonella]EPD79148.1 hypothetical protein HMPREF1477_01322 [Veillonella sp. HPA0037]MBS7012764.1 hypothetical protein [Veillonella sp.]MDU4409341.1 hypothetical protein [Veillonella sp.]MDU4443598.1 hypothetical protein [Veillonella sp.]MDU6734525.1 hypothetical protein [Veillonella sp.]
MLRKSIIMMLLATAFTINVSAVQIEVPAGQPPMPGADASIPANAYENYRADSLSNVGASDVIKLHSESKKRMEMYITDWGLTRDEVNQIASDSEKLIDLIVNETAVVLLHDDRNNIRASVPGLLLVSKYYPKRSDGERLSIVRENSIFFAIGTKPNYDDALGKLKSERKGEFIYPGISHGKWAIDTESFGENTPAMVAVVGLDNQPNQEYMIGLSYKNQPVTNKIERVMSNYVIPSIRSLDDLDHYSESISWDNLMYRIPKGLKLTAQKSLKDSAKIRDYRGLGMQLVVAKEPVKVDDKYIYSFINEISEVKPESQIIGDAPIQSASVWNNGVPSLLVDNYQPGKKSLMYRFLRDDKNIYIMSLVYTDGAVPYSHIQLRNTVEYSDFANIETLRNKVIRMQSREKM